MIHELEVAELEFSYRRWRPPQVRVESLMISSGVSFLVGPNGSGKSTLLKLLAGLVPPRGGRIAFDGNVLEAGGDSRHRMAPTGYLRQDYAVRGRTTVSAFLRYGAWMHGVAPDRLESRSRELLGEVGMTDVGRTRVGRLSGGMQRRLGIAVELSHAPVLVLLDEPTSGLDYDARERMHAVVGRVVERGAVVVISSHEESEISRYDARLHVMREGRVVASEDHRRGDPVRIADLLGGGP